VSRGWAPGPHAHWQRLDENPRFSVSGPDRLTQLEQDARTRLEALEVERERSESPYKFMSAQDLRETHGRVQKQISNLDGWTKVSGRDPGVEEQIAGWMDRLTQIREEESRRHEWYNLQRQLAAVALSREKGVPILERSDVGRLLGKLQDVYAESGWDMRKKPPYMPERFKVSDLSGKGLRWYFTLPDGRIAHPDEIHEARRRKRLVVVDDIPVPDRDWTLGSSVAINSAIRKAAGR